MSRRNKKQEQKAMEGKLDQILLAVSEVNHKVDRQNVEIEALRREVVATKKLVDEMAKKNRKDALIAGGLGGGLAAIGFELLRMKFGM
ncbi:hypothetical protein [Otariodibacter oris]|uniref:ElaB/YqjD/DUF883 family membrane-anchored ribosome-binding protein n=1 Tax=Otariodibacter oris TaxID=1032623 RepID=A0A420XIU6_9PAST|nr:hypothetical protein [Otariodibacter oris]QGM80673.1 hypothetical protein A6A10_04275 [Otariodibacter oris]RKR77166.1 hypothetical protein DES31_0491 [Otariodibacter oris]